MTDHQLRSLPASFLELDLADEAATHQLANDIGMVLRPGDVICLSGDLGAGKSTFTRSLLRAISADPELEVPSPTFTLVQTYEFDRFDLSHFDLYRLEEPEELEELGLDDLLETGAALIEWPEKAEEFLPRSALWMQISQPEEESERRSVSFYSGDASWSGRVRETLNTRTFLKTSGLETSRRHFLAGDASLRSFETVVTDGRQSVLMRWPFQESGVASAVRDYMRKVHLAEDCRSVIAVAGELRKRGFLTAEIYRADLQNGLLLMQDLGRETIAPDGKAIPERYHAAVRVLAGMHNEPWPDAVPLVEGGTYQLPAYTTDALITEASLFLDWYVPETTGAAASEQTRDTFASTWKRALEGLDSSQTGWVLRDFHSPNLLWQEDGTGNGKIGLIDVQDTVIGPVAYDVASLCLDARVDISEDLEAELLNAYFSEREFGKSGSDGDRFLAAYSVMAAQRISKILGIFVRLARRDGKPAYLSHLPRMLGYLDRVLDRPGMSDLKDLYKGLLSNR